MRQLSLPPLTPDQHRQRERLLAQDRQLCQLESQAVEAVHAQDLNAAEHINAIEALLDRHDQDIERALEEPYSQAVQATHEALTNTQAFLGMPAVVVANALALGAVALGSAGVLASLGAGQALQGINAAAALASSAPVMDAAHHAAPLGLACALVCVGMTAAAVLIEPLKETLGLIKRKRREQLVGFKGADEVLSPFEAQSHPADAPPSWLARTLTQKLVDRRLKSNAQPEREVSSGLGPAV